MINPRQTKKQVIAHVMRACDIETVSSAVLCNGEITPMTLALSDDRNLGGNFVKEIKEEPVCGAASLSKTVFAYLVLKLIAENQSNNDKLSIGQFHFPVGLVEFNIDTPLYKILPELSLCPDRENAEKLTARIVLSHQSGIPHSHNSGPPTFDFMPGTEYVYNGLPYFYLQIALERLTESTLEDLAKAYIFDPKDTQSTFLGSGFTAEDARIRLNHDIENKVDLFAVDISTYPTISANSLRTTVSGYMNIIKQWINDESLLYAFAPQISMTKDKWARDMNVPMASLEKLSSGLGWALQKKDDGKFVAFHWADMNQLRADVAIDLDKKTAVAFFASNENGHVLLDHIISPEIELNDGLKFISQKLGFAVRFERDWKKGQDERMADIGNYLSGNVDSGSTYTSPSPLSTKLKPPG